MNIEYQISFVDALAIIDPAVFSEMDEEFLYAFDIFLDKDGESELVFDFPGEEWNEVWNRETRCVRDFIEAHKMVLWRIQEGDYKGELVEVNQELTVPQELEVIGDSVLVLSASELIQCLLYPDVDMVDMEIFAEIPFEKGTVLFEKEGYNINFLRK